MKHMKSMKYKKKYLTALGLLLFLGFSILLMLDAIHTLQSDDAAKSWMNYLGQSVNAAYQLLIAIIIIILLIICAYFFLFEKAPENKQQKLTGKQKKKAKQYDALRKQSNFRKF